VVALDIWLSIIILIIALVVLNKASDITITYASKTSEIAGLAKTAVGFILIAFSTSLPEMSVSIMAATGGSGEIGVAIGNIFGSNIVNICAIIGLAVILVTFRRRNNVNIVPVMAKEEFGSLYFGLFVASIIPLSLIYIAEVGRLIGIILLVVFSFYTYQISKMKIPDNNGIQNKTSEDNRKFWKHVVFTFLGIAGVIASSRFIVDASVNIAENLGIPKTLIGATIIAFGTSLPEFATSIEAINQGQPALAFGNIVGSCFVNITLILSIPLMAAPFRVNMIVFSNMVIFSLMSNLLLWYFLSNEKITWREGAILLFIYFIFLASSFGVLTIPQNL